MNKVHDTDLVDRLVEALVFSMQIPEGIELVAILGKGDEPNNRAVLKTWVLSNLRKIDEDSGRIVLPLLQEYLANELEECRW